MTGSLQWTGGILPFQEYLLSGGLGVQRATSLTLDKTGDVVVALVQKGMLELEVSGDDFDYVGDDDLVEPIHK